MVPGKLVQNIHLASLTDVDRWASDLAIKIYGLATVLTLGNYQYPTGAFEDFQRSYERSWGQLTSITHPSIGNHEGLGEAYYTYFGAAAGSPDRRYYNFDIGEWHVVALNSNTEPDCGL